MAGMLKNGGAITTQGGVAELAESPAVRNALQWFARERQWIQEQHIQLCRIPAPTFLEQNRAEWMAAQFRALGWDARIDRGGNVVALLAPNHQGAFVAVTAHLDTVLVPRKPEEILADPDGRLHGPGVSDNGVGLAALLALARALKTFSLAAGPVAPLLVANVGEEGEGNLSGMRYLCRQSPLAPRIRAFLALDGPATDHITAEALASRRFEAVFTGPGGHSWSDFGIANPVHALSRAIALFTDEQQDAGSRPRSSYNFGAVQGGSSVTSIPSEARLKVDVRSESPTRIDELAQQLAAAIERAVLVENQRSTGARVVARMREIGSRPGGLLPPDAAILQHVRAVDAYLGIKSRLDCASTDANIPLSLGLPAISIGAGGQGGGAHTAHEWYHPEGRELGLKRVLLTLLLLTGS